MSQGRFPGRGARVRMLMPVGWVLSEDAWPCRAAPPSRSHLAASAQDFVPVSVTGHGLSQVWKARGLLLGQGQLSGELRRAVRAHITAGIQ